jgi:hypothetical protein
LAGTGNAVVPFSDTEGGDTNMFAVPPKGLTVSIIENNDSNCTLRLFNPKGEELAVAPWKPGMGTVTLDANGSPKAYIFDDGCAIRVLAQP